MKHEFKEILRKAINHPGGIISPVDMINGLAGGSQRSVEYLVSYKYIEYVPVDKRDFKGNYTIQFYRVTEKGHRFFDPWYSKAWSSLKGDLRSIIISLVTALGTTLITIYINKYFL